jgi:hypothetical protein
MSETHICAYCGVLADSVDRDDAKLAAHAAGGA